MTVIPEADVIFIYLKFNSLFIHSAFFYSFIQFGFKRSSQAISTVIYMKLLECQQVEVHFCFFFHCFFITILFFYIMNITGFRIIQHDTPLFLSKNRFHPELSEVILTVPSIAITAVSSAKVTVEIQCYVLYVKKYKHFQDTTLRYFNRNLSDISWQTRHSLSNKSDIKSWRNSFGISLCSSYNNPQFHALSKAWERRQGRSQNRFFILLSSFLY